MSSIHPISPLTDSWIESTEIGERFKELHPPLTAQAAVVEANRCLYCFDAPCMVACPTHIDVPGFIKRIASGNLRGSARIILDANVLGGSCSRACPVEVLCEGACVMHRHDRPPIQIALLQRRAMDAFHASGERLIPMPIADTSLSVACIGSGPASLACAAELRRHGARVTIFESRALPGGLNTYGIAEYKLPIANCLREVELIRETGVEFRLNSEIKTAADLAAIESEFDYVFLGVGLGAMQRLGIDGEDACGGDVGSVGGVINALQLIAAYKTGHLTQMSGAVVVIGAGNTAIDAAVAARRLGADPVTMIYRRGQGDVSAFDFELAHAREEGINFIWNRLPLSIRKGDGQSMLIDIHAVRHVDGKFEAVAETVQTLVCDTIIPAIGQSPLTALLSEFREVRVERGQIVVDRASGATANPKYFAGGDCANGGREVVDAVADGKRAAIGILAAAEVTHG